MVMKETNKDRSDCIPKGSNIPDRNLWPFTRTFLCRYTWTVNDCHVIHDSHKILQNAYLKETCCIAKLQCMVIKKSCCLNRRSRESSDLGTNKHSLYCTYLGCFSISPTQNRSYKPSANQITAWHEYQLGKKLHTWRMLWLPCETFPDALWKYIPLWTASRDSFTDSSSAYFCFWRRCSITNNCEFY
jgi:hypothetical protein